MFSLNLSLKNTFAAATLLIMTAGCKFPPKVYRIDVQQGNYITKKMVNKLKPGMTKKQVKKIMGTSTIVPTFNDDRWDYRYYLIPGDGSAKKQKVLTIFFKNNKLSSLEGHGTY